MKFQILENWVAVMAVIFERNIILNLVEAHIWLLESVQDFLIKLDTKPRMHLVETSIFSLNLVIVRPTKIMNRVDKNLGQF